uniref:Perforin-1-like n=1 Tax=Sphaeramia orbicularis TaxID=375764 RepID=A0A672Y474_9TELE
MVLVLFLLLLVRASTSCQVASFTECQQASFVPGHNLAGEGFDVVKMQTSGASVIDVKTFMSGGVQGNCTVCHNPLLNQTQKLPTSVLDWRVKVQCRRSLSSQVFESSQSVLKETSQSLGIHWKVGLSLPNLGGFAVGGSHSTSSKFAESRSKKDKFSFTTHDFKCRYYTFRLHSRPPLSKDFHVSLQNLPTTFHHRNTSAFRHFISIYGTHFIRRVHLGGRVHSITAVRTCEASMYGLSVQAVSDCLSAEANAAIDGAKVDAASSFCKKKRRSLKTGATFSQAFADRTTEVLGGDGDVGDILFNPQGKKGYRKWLRSLRRVPGVVWYDISPLHRLVRSKVTDNHILRSSLRDAISDYIRQSAKPLRCPSRCKAGTQTRTCACRCHGHRMVNADCCPAEPGIARMNVTVVRGEGLWGDYFSKTDGYVKVFYGGRSSVTPVIWNNNFPSWNYRIRLQTVNLRRRTPIRFEVWDRDNGWNDDLLGRAVLIPTVGSVQRKFRLNHGALLVQVSAACAPSLQGALCQQYLATPTYDRAMPTYNRATTAARGQHPGLREAGVGGRS